MKTPFFRIAPEGVSTVFVVAVAGWLFSLAGFGTVSFLFFIAFVFTLFFFRDPQRNAPADDGSVLAPSDGRVIEVKTERENSFLHCDVTRVSVFLSVFDCHVNWFPVSGEVKDSQRRAGKFNLGFSLAATKENERVETLIKPDGGGPEFLMAQVAGFVARRIVSHASKGAHLKRGQRFGIIKFGSRIDLFFPSGYDVKVFKGDVVKGSETVVARHIGDDIRS